MRKGIRLLSLLAISFVAISADMSNGASSSHASDKATPKRAISKMKNVIIVGAKGHTSEQIIPRVLEQEDVRLTLFLRRASRLQHLAGSRVDIVEGDAGDLDDLREAFQGQAIVDSSRPINLKTAEVIEKSSLDYTILRPVWLTDNPTETFELTRKGETYKGSETSRASLGRFVADVVRTKSSPYAH